uniref:SPIN90/Ldb17 leucine-rich domain-containing protein n=1 Tax=Plectus sambesii TaxID=2011161 RepID=A0A914UT40_9BILA
MEYKTEVDPRRVAQDLVELLRLETDIAYSKCRSSVISLVAMLKDDLNIAQLQPVFDYLNQEDLLDVDGCVDAQRLSSCLKAINGFKEDSQQRSWSLYEDEQTIVDRLNELSSLVRFSDSRVPIHVFADNDYRSSFDLVEFYQMETRLTVKLALVDALLVLCRIDRKFVDIQLQTGLAVYVVGDIAANESELGSKCVQLLTLLFCTGHAPPIGHYDALNDGFVQRILEAINDASTSEKFAELCMNFLLSFNLHFIENNESLVIKALLQSNVTSAFIQRFLLLANREEDPVWPFAGEPPYASSVLKMLRDLLATAQLGDRLFYSNDVSVLVNILLRELADCSPGKRRITVLQAVREMTCNTSLAAGRVDDFSEVVGSIRDSEDSLDEEKSLAAEIVDKLASK